MASVPPKHRRKRVVTVLANSRKNRYITKVKSKSCMPIYQKLKANNRSLAKALSQEKQECQMLFTRNIELVAQVQDLIHACNTRDAVISNILKSNKESMKTIITMSGHLANQISLCQEFVSNQINPHRTSTSSAGRRESTMRMSTKSPARGVVKPMVSGHTITKPTINLSRVNMQRLTNNNLSKIVESPTTPERTLDRSVENRRSRTLSEIRRSEGENEDRSIVSRRTNRYSGSRLSSGRYSKRNSGRLSGGNIAGRLSKRSSEYSELIKNPQVTLQDVSRYLTDNQTVNIRMLNETSAESNEATVVEDTQINDDSSSGSEDPVIIPETQESNENTEEEMETNNTLVNSTSKSERRNPCRSEHWPNAAIESDSSNDQNDSTEMEGVNKTVTMRSPKVSFSSSSFDKPSLNRNSLLESDVIDPKEGPSWLYDSNSTTTDRVERTSNKNCNYSIQDMAQLVERQVNMSNNCSMSVSTTPKTNGISAYRNYSINNEDEDEGDRRMNLRFVTQRRGPSVRESYGNDDDDDDDTMMLNIQRQLRPSPPESHERLQFNPEDLLQMSPFKKLMSMNYPVTDSIQMQLDTECTKTIQITQRLQQPDNTETIGNKTTMKMCNNLDSQNSMRNQDPDSPRAKRFSDLTTTRLSSVIDLPRLTEIQNISDIEKHQQSEMISPINDKPEKIHKRKRIVRKCEDAQLESDDNEIIPKQRKNKSSSRKKKCSQKDPSSAKVVLQKLSQTPKTSFDSTFLTSSRQEPLSDSESSNASIGSRQMPLRPRREKAPKNLQEPSLLRKLRR